TRHPSQDWKGIMGFRDVLGHQYFSVDLAQILLVSRQAMPQLRLEILLMIRQLNN
uniref:HepT-like ribonuclease domain-containing protein n=1 Tax=Synechococcus lacustris TaxID=2116544 RepID=UPI0033400D93